MSSYYATDFLREFHVALIFGSVDTPVMWGLNNWPEFIASVEPLVNAARGPAASEGCYALPSNKRLKLVNFKSRDWRDIREVYGIFGIWNLSAPSDAACARQKRTPDVYAAVSNHKEVMMADLRFNPLITLAIGAEMADSAALLDTAVQRIATLTSAVMVAKKVRTWGVPTETGYSNGISETSWLISGLAGRNPSAEILSEKWDDVVVYSGSFGRGA
jgi:hypothetical protein